MRRLVWVALLGAIAMGCSSSNGSASSSNANGGVALMSGFDPGPAPDPSQGFQVVLPIVSGIKAGGSYEYCTWTGVTLDHDVWIKSSKGMQSQTGHHIVVYYTTTPQPAGTTRLCNDSDMAGFRFAVASLGEGSSGQDNVLPGDLAVHVPAGVQIVINHHYLNATAQDVAQAQSAVDVFYADPNSTIVQSSSLAFVDTSMSIPPGNSSIDITCTMNNDYPTWNLFPHMHNYGTHITVDHISGTNTKRLFDLDWDPTYAFHPPTMTSDPSTPYVLKKGDQIHVHCDYNNTTNAPLTFGAEMCVTYAATIDANRIGNMACDEGSWSPF